MFHVHLFSNVYENGNTIADFNTHLADSLQLDGYEVGLSEIAFTNSWYNLKEDAAIIVYLKTGQLYTTTTVPAGRYCTRQALLDVVNVKIFALEKTLLQSLVEPNIKPTFIINTSTHRVDLNPENDSSAFFNFYLDTSLRALLGRGAGEAIKEFATILESMPEMGRSKQAEFDGAVPGLIKELIKKDSEDDVQIIGDITGGIRSILVYTNIIRHGLVGNTKAQLLKVVHVDDSAGVNDQVFRSYPQPEFKPLLNSDIDQIHIWLFDDAGDLIAFKFGRVRLTFCFRPIRNGGLLY